MLKYAMKKDEEDRKLAFSEPLSNQRYEAVNEEKYGKALDKKKGKNTFKSID
jgi:hypothetical protein